MGPEKSISNELIIDHSISTKSVVILEIILPLLFSVKNPIGREITFLCNLDLKSCTTPFLIGVK